MFAIFIPAKLAENPNSLNKQNLEKTLSGRILTTHSTLYVSASKLIGFAKEVNVLIN